MKITKDKLNLKNLKDEYILTNGLGSYCSSSVLGINTRKYHGLFFASLNSPSKRKLILSKLDESLTIGDSKYDLFSNMCLNYTSEGYKYLTGFEKDEFATFKYMVKNVEITKKICFVYGKNTLCIKYKVVNNQKQDAKLELAPVVNFRDLHCINKNKDEYEISKKGNLAKIIIDGNLYCPIYTYVDDGTSKILKDNYFENMYYEMEKQRGFECLENHVVPIVYEIDIPKNSSKEITFICSLEKNIKDINIYDVIDCEKNRVKNLSVPNNVKKIEQLEVPKQDAKLFEKMMSIALDNFIVMRKSLGLHTLIAGYPWFLDWGRDSLISFEILMLTKKIDIAKDVLLTYSKNIKDGLVPNGFDEQTNRPLYNSADASLLLIESVNIFLKYTKDYEFVKKKLYKNIKNILKNYIKGITLDDNNIYLDTDNLLNTGSYNTQNTWMDAKVNGVPVTPRNGKTVELNALLYNALKIAQNLAYIYCEPKNAKYYDEIAEQLKQSFNSKFYNKQKKSLYDVLGDDKIRPNQLYALSLSYNVIDLDSKVASNVLKIVSSKLKTSYGLRTLDKDDENYVDKYYGDELRRDSSYHNGITWPYLLGIYYDCLKNQKRVYSKKKDYESKKRAVELELEINNLRKETYKIFKEEIQTGCIGQISEIYDSSKPYLQNGAFAQCWSISQIYKIILGG